MKEAGPSTPVKVLGFTGLPNAGDELTATDSGKFSPDAQRRTVARLRNHKLAMPQRATLESLFDNLDEGKKHLQLILKCDVQGSAEAIGRVADQIESKKIDLELFISALGAISESDVLLATASNAVIVGFQCQDRKPSGQPPPSAKESRSSFSASSTS